MLLRFGDSPMSVIVAQLRRRTLRSPRQTLASASAIERWQWFNELPSLALFFHEVAVFDCVSNFTRSANRSSLSLSIEHRSSKLTLAAAWCKFNVRVRRLFTFGFQLIFPFSRFSDTADMQIQRQAVRVRAEHLVRLGRRQADRLVLRRHDLVVLRRQGAAPGVIGLVGARSKRK